MNGNIAGLGSRFIALIIDNVVVVIVGYLVNLAFSTPVAGGLVGFAIGALYQAYFLSQRNGQTPGKSFLGLRVVKTDSSTLSAADAFIRYVGYYLNSFFIALGWLWAIFDANRQGWHDKLARTYVVRA